MSLSGESGTDLFLQQESIALPAGTEPVDRTGTGEQTALELKAQYLQRLEKAATQIMPLDISQLPEVYKVLAPQLHQNWQREYAANPKNRTGDGKNDFLPRWKPAPGALAWLHARLADPATQRTVRFNPQTGESEVDIARTDFNDLPPIPWIIENQSAVMHAVTIVHRAVIIGEPLEELFLEEASSHVHEAWIHRNRYIKETAEDPAEEAVRAIQRLNYEHTDFTEEERNKDREHIALAAEAYARIGQQLQIAKDITKHSNKYSKLLRQSPHRLGQTVAHLAGLIYRPEKPSPLHKTLHEDITNLSTTVAQLAKGWPEVRLAIDEDGAFTRMYAMIRPDHKESFVARITYKALDSDEVIGAELRSSHCYETFFYTKLPNNRQRKPYIYFGEDVPHSVDGPFAVQVNNETAIRRAKVLLRIAIQHAAVPSKTKS